MPTVSSGTFDPRFLTERQQLQYLAQKTLSSGGDDTLEVSPLRLDRIKLEEKRMLELQQRTKHTDEVSKHTDEVSKKSDEVTKKSDETLKKSEETLKRSEETLKRSQESSPSITPHKKSRTKASDPIKSSPRQLASSPLAPSNRPNRRSTNNNNNNNNNNAKKNALIASSLLKECFVEEKRGEEIKISFDNQLIEEATIVDVYELNPEHVLKEATFKTSESTINPEIANNFSDSSNTSNTTNHNTSTISTNHNTTTITALSIGDRVKGFLDYTRSVRQKHLNALLEAMKVRRGMSPEEVESKRKQLEAQL